MFSLTGWTAAGFSVEEESAHSPEPEPVFVHLEEGVYTADLEQSEINWADRNPHSSTTALSIYPPSVPSSLRRFHEAYPYCDIQRAA
jgi:hypothetical protein